MIDVRSLVAALVGLASAAAFAYVGGLQWRRQAIAAHLPAVRAFAVAWLAGGAYAALSAAVVVVAAVRGPSPAFEIAAAWIGVLFSVVMLAGLVAYLLYILTGSPRVVRLVAAAYAAQLVGVVAILAAYGPRAAIATGLTIRFAFAAEHASVGSWLALTLLLPTLAASLAYLAMLREAHSPTGRWRIILLGGGLTLWTTLAIIARWGGSPAAFAGARIAAALLALAAVLAYAPPHWAARRWGIASVRDEIVVTRRTQADRAQREAALAARLKDLI